MEPATLSELVEAYPANIAGSAQSLFLLAPEGALLLAAIVILVSRRLASHRLTPYFAHGAVLIASWLTMLANDQLRNTGRVVQPIGDGLFVLDATTTFFRLLFLLAALTGIAMRQSSSPGRGECNARPQALVLLASLGGMVAAAAGDLVTLWLGLELLTVATVFLMILSRTGESVEAPVEATTKLLIASALASAMMLFGMAYVFGLTGSTSLANVQATLVDGTAPARAQGAEPMALLVPVLLVFCGLAARLAVFPMHFFAADTAEGCPPAVAGFALATLPVAGAAALLRFFAPLTSLAEGPVALLPGLAPEVYAPWGGMLQLAAATSLLLGSLASLASRELPRMLAGAAVTQSGLLLAGLAMLPARLAIAGACVHLLAFVLALTGVFAVLPAQSDNRPAAGSLAGLAGRAPVAASAAVVCLAGLAGIPPTAGFVGRWLLLDATFTGGAVWLAGCAVVASTILFIPLVRLAWTIVFAEPEPGQAEWTPSFLSSSICVALAIPTLLLLVLPTGLQGLLQGLGVPGGF